MKISVVVATHNRQATLRTTLNSLRSQDYQDFDITVVDDGSSDGTDTMVIAEFPTVRYLHQSNKGPAAARNAGIRSATGDVVAFTDDDCDIPADWLHCIADGYARNPNAAGVGGYLEAPAELLRTNRIAQYESYLSHQTYGAGAQEYYGGFECPAGGTNNMSYCKKILDEVGGFDESFPYAAGEDADLKWRICQRGYRLLYLPKPVIHLRPYKWEDFRHQQIVRGKGSIYFDAKHGRVPTRMRLLLRIAKRLVMVGSDSLRIGPSLSWVKLWSGLYECWGQWLELSAMRSAS